MDDNIKIAIIQTLCLDDNADIIAKVNAVEYQKYHEKIDEGDGTGWFDVIEEVKQQILAIELTQAQLESITHLSGESEDVHFKIMPH